MKFLLLISRSMAPFSLEIHTYEIFKKVEILVKRYIGISNLFDHIEEFEAVLDAYNTRDADKCKGFPITLEGNVGTWFWMLARGFIESFEDLWQVFLTKFIQTKKQSVTDVALVTVKKSLNESVRN